MWPFWRQREQVFHYSWSQYAAQCYIVYFSCYLTRTMTTTGCPNPKQYEFHWKASGVLWDLYASVCGRFRSTSPCPAGSAVERIQWLLSFSALWESKKVWAVTLCSLPKLVLQGDARAMDIVTWPLVLIRFTLCLSLDSGDFSFGLLTAGRSNLLCFLLSVYSCFLSFTACPNSLVLKLSH